MKNRCLNLSENFIDKYKKAKVPWGPIGYIVYKRTYARQLDHNKTEEWWQTVKRCVNAILMLGVFTQEEAETLYHYVFNLKCCFSGRALWQLGTKTVERFGGDSLQSCWGVAINDPILPFCFTFDKLMLGGGVGYNLQKTQVYSMPIVKYAPPVSRVNTDDCDFIVPDNREGWIKLLSKVLKCHYYTGRPITYSTSCIRPRGQKISSFGGVASGSEELVKGISSIVDVLRHRVGYKLEPIDCLDIMNIIGSIVVSGNVRRSAELALGDVDDTDYTSAKNWNRVTVPNWRSMSNNSVIISKYDDFPSDLWSMYLGEGEPLGFVNLELCRTIGRLIDGYYDDKRVIGVNPCAEITLEAYESCNLVELFMPNLHNDDEFFTAATLMYKVAKSISTLPCIHKETNEVVTRNRRLGIGVGGLMQSKWRCDNASFDNIYNYLCDIDLAYSKILGVNQSIKLTTVKPSGTISLLAGITPGVHAAYAPYYIRRVSMASDDPLLDTCMEHGYKVSPKLNIDGTSDLKTMVVDFPIKTPDNTIFAKDLSAVQQLENQRWLQSYWSDNSVSCTIYYQKEELPEIRAWLSSNMSEVKSTSFLLHSEHGFVQAPLEEISEERYNELISETKPIDSIESTFESTDSEFECSKGGCPIK